MQMRNCCFSAKEVDEDDEATGGSIITRVDDELCQKLICRQARKSAATLRAEHAPRLWALS